MYEYLCSCLPLSRQVMRAGVNRILGYLNSNNMNQQILEEEKCLDEYENRQGASVYELSHSKAYRNLQREDGNTADNNLHDQQPNIEQDESDLSEMTREQYLLHMVKIQLAAFRKHLISDPQEQSFERLMESPDNQLAIYYNQRLNAQSKRLSLYRFEYTLEISFSEFLKIYKEGGLNEVDSNLSFLEVVEQIDDNLQILYEQYKKVLVVTPRDFLYLRYREMAASQKEYLVVATSMKDQSLKPSIKFPEFTRGNIILAGTVISEIDSNHVRVKSYMEIDLNLTINPQMIKQPAMREIKKYVEKVADICKSHNESLRTQQQKASNQATYPNDSPLISSIEGI